MDALCHSRQKAFIGVNYAKFSSSYKSCKYNSAVGIVCGFSWAARIQFRHIWSVFGHCDFIPQSENESQGLWIFHLIGDCLIKVSDANWVVYIWCLISKQGCVGGTLSLPSEKRQHKKWYICLNQRLFCQQLIKIDSEGQPSTLKTELWLQPLLNHSKCHDRITSLFSKTELSLR